MAAPGLPYNAATEQHVPWRSAAAPALPACSACGNHRAAAAPSPSAGGGNWAAALPQAATVAAQPVAAAAAQASAAATAEAAPSGSRRPIEDLGADLRALWQVQDEFGHWIDYDPGFNASLEKAYQEGVEVIRHTPGKAVEFVFYILSFVHENSETRRRRVMRRLLIQGRMQDGHAGIVKHCEEYNNVYHALQESHRRQGRGARSRSGSRARSVTRG